MNKTRLLSAAVFGICLFAALWAIFLPHRPSGTKITLPTQSPSEYVSFANYLNGGRVAYAGGALYYANSNGVRQIKDGEDTAFCRDFDADFVSRVYGYRDLLYVVSGPTVYLATGPGNADKILENATELVAWHDRLFYLAMTDEEPSEIIEVRSCRTNGTAPVPLVLPDGYRLSDTTEGMLFLFGGSLYIRSEKTMFPETEMLLRVGDDLSVTPDEAVTAAVADARLLTERVALVTDQTTGETAAVSADGSARTPVPGYDDVTALKPAIFDTAAYGDALYVNAFSGHYEKGLGAVKRIENDNTLPQVGLWRIDLAAGSAAKLADEPVYTEMYVFDGQSIYYFKGDKLRQFVLP